MFEYPLVLSLACIAAPSIYPYAKKLSLYARDVLYPAALGGFTYILITQPSNLGLNSDTLITILGYGLPVLLCAGFMRRPLRFGIGVAALFFAATFATYQTEDIIHTDRSFFGVNQVALYDYGDANQYRILLHGNTVHGMQCLDTLRKNEPMSYYTRNGPVGQMFNALGNSRSHDPVAVIGLGCGVLVSYAKENQRWDLYEIDPAVERLARDPHYFSFIRDCAPNAKVILGDARLSLAHAPDALYGLIFLDAYSSDSPPLHLLTREAIQLYLKKLAPHGLLIFNITNRHFNLQRLVSALVIDAGLPAIIGDDMQAQPGDEERGKIPSRWLVAARSFNDFEPLVHDQRWKPAQIDSAQKVWTDDFASLLSIMTWK